MNIRMPTLNSVLISGNLTSDPRSNILTSGTHVCNFRIAANERYKDKDGEWKSKVCYVDVVCWKGIAERAAARLQKGSPVVVDGKLQYTEWTGDDGASRARLEILARGIQMIEKREEGQPRNSQPSDNDEPDYSDDIPF